MIRHLALALLIAAPALAQNAPLPAQDQHQHDPAWPCIQRKQPHLSLAQVWTGPVSDAKPSPEIAALAAGLAQRRLPVEEAEAQIATFAQTATPDDLATLMQAIFARVEPQRTALIQGIGRYAARQQGLARQIEDRRAKMAELEQADPPDFDAIDAEEKALDWDTRIFTERRQSLTYVCETPVLLEQRLFALGRAIAGHLPK